jgi:PPM family protein phosphatase
MSLLKYGVGSNVGKIRTHNEDYFSADPETGIWIVADGMGGHAGGETASALAVDFIAASLKKSESLATSIARAHHVIKEESENGKGPEGMGTTVVALRATNHEYEIAWVGDCRAYLWDGVHLTQLTKDHSYVQHLVDTGVISENEMSHHPYQDILFQALGAKDINDVNVELVTRQWHQREQILLCSDGLTKELAHKDIADILSRDASEQEKADTLIQMALQKGGKDNITVMVISARDDAPVNQPQQDTSFIDSEISKVSQAGIGERVFSWVKKYWRF